MTNLTPLARRGKALIVLALTATATLAACSDPGSTSTAANSSPAAAPAGGSTGGTAPATASSTTGAATLPKVTTDPKVAALVPASIKSSGTLTLATNAPYAPLEYFESDNKTLTGYDIDLGSAVAEVMGLKPVWKNIGFDAIIPGLQAGRYDVGMAGFSIAPDRLGTVDFVSYYLSGGGFLIQKGSHRDIKSFASLCGMSVAVQIGASQVDALTAASKSCAARGRSGIHVLQVPNENDAVLDLSSGRADVVAADKPQVEYAAGQDSAMCVVSTYQTGHSIAGMAVSKHDPKLADALKAAMNSLIASGAYAQLSRYWNVGVPVRNAVAQPAFSKLAAGWGIGANGTIAHSLVFTSPKQVSSSDSYYFQPVQKGCAG